MANGIGFAVVVLAFFGFGCLATFKPEAIQSLYAKGGPFPKLYKSASYKHGLQVTGVAIMIGTAVVSLMMIVR